MIRFLQKLSGFKNSTSSHAFVHQTRHISEQRSTGHYYRQTPILRKSTIAKTMAMSLRPPVNRAMKSLDRSFFNLNLSISVARIHHNQHISEFRSKLQKSNDLIEFERLSPIHRDPDPHLAVTGRKCLLLRSNVKHNDSSTWSQTIQELVDAEQIGILPFTLDITYDYWTYHDIMSSILPEDALEEIPAGFQIIGHVAHLNLRDNYLPYKNLIASVILDKNPSIKTVINKIDTVGEESEYRTFSYEVIAGEDNMNVSVREQDCVYEFNYAKVYWNSKLNTEHERLVAAFQPSQAVCDVMAGIGPFALPAGKKKVFVWANDLNPESHRALQSGIRRNKVEPFVRPFNRDGRAFIVEAVRELYRQDTVVEVPSKPSRAKKAQTQIPAQRFTLPKVFSHFVMNLPASALSFLPSFIGVYQIAGIPKNQPLPQVHVHCFGLKDDDNSAEFNRLCKHVSSLLHYEFTPGDSTTEGQLYVHDVRDVAPKKRMFCISFRLPAEVAYRT